MGDNTITTYFYQIGPLGLFDLAVAISVCLCVSLFDDPFHVVYFEAYFAPTSQSRMSKIFRDLESLGKSARKKWSKNGTFLLGSGLKSPRKKSFFFLLILPYKTWWKPRFLMDYNGAYPVMFIILFKTIAYNYMFCILIHTFEYFHTFEYS